MFLLLAFLGDLCASVVDLFVFEGMILRELIHVLVFLALVMSAHQAAAAVDVAGRAEIIAGAVSIERGGRQETLKAGDTVFVLDRITTGAGSSVEVVLSDGSRMKLAADTGLEITAYEYDLARKTRHAFISLITGKARFFVQDFQEFDDRRFRVQTRTAVVASRDTDFIVSYEPELPRDEVCRGGLTDALCLENSIIVTGLKFQDKPALLTARMMSQVCGPHLPTPPRFAAPAELARIKAGLDRIGDAK